MEDYREMMETIQNFLESDLYLSFIQKLGRDHFEEKQYTMELLCLKDRLKQRQYLLEGFHCQLQSEKEIIEFYQKIMEENRHDIIRWIQQFWEYSRHTSEDYPDGEFPEGEEIDEEDKSSIIMVGKYVRSSIAQYLIEFDILKNHSEILSDYYKRLRIPDATKYAKEMKKLFHRVFPNESEWNDSVFFSK